MSNTKLPALDTIVSEAMRRYLRVCSSGGMSKRRIDTVMASVEDAERLDYFKLAIARAILADRERQAGEAVAQDQEAAELLTWFSEAKGFSQGTKAPHKWVLRAERAIRRLASLPAPQAVQADSTPLQVFESYKARVVMEAFQEGWAACRDAEYVGEEAENDAFNRSHTINHCIAYDLQHAAAPSPDGKAEQVEAPSEPAAIIAPRPELQHALFCYATGTDGANAVLLRGWEALVARVEEEVACGPDDKWRDILADLDDWQDDGWGVPHKYTVNFEDGYMSIYTVSEDQPKRELATQPTASNAGERERIQNLYEKHTGLFITSEKGLENLLAFVAALATKPPAGEQKPFAWATFDGEGSYDLRLFEDNEDYRDQFIKRNGPQFTSWVLALYLGPQPEQVAQDAEHAENYRLIRRGQHWSVVDGIGNTLRGEDLDAAVDAIRAARARGEGGASHG